MLKITEAGGYTIDCNYIIRVKDHMNIDSFPIILVESGEDP